MKTILAIVSLFLLGCASDAGTSDTTSPQDLIKTDNLSEDVTIDEVSTAPPILWQAMEGASLDEVKSVQGFGAARGGIYLTVDSPAAAGLFRLDLAATDTGFSHVFDGIGPTLVTESGTYMAMFQNNKGSLVQIDDAEEAADLAFNFENPREIRWMLEANNLLYMLNKDWSNAENMVNRGSPAVMAWDQVGPSTNETALGIHTNGDKLLMVTSKNEPPLGLACHQAPANSDESQPWQDCPGFPTHEMQGRNDSYSVLCGLTGEGDHMAAWFQILKTGKKSWEVQLGNVDGTWNIAQGAPADREPSAMLVTDSQVFLGYKGLQDGQQVFAAPLNGDQFEPVGFGFPAPEQAKSGVAGLAWDGSSLYAAWLDYNPGGSLISIYTWIEK